MTKSDKIQIRKIISTSILSAGGSGILSFLISLYVLKQYGGQEFMFIQIATTIPSLFSLFFAGYIIDKYNRKLIAVSIQMLSIMSLVLILTQTINLVNLLILVFVLRLLDSIQTTNSMSSATLQVNVESINKLRSYEQTMVSGISVLIPIVGAIAYVAIPLKSMIMVEIVIELVALLLICFTHYDLHYNTQNETLDNEENTNKMSLLGSLYFGFSYIFKNKILKSVILCALAFNFVSGLETSAMDPYQIDTLHLSNVTFGTVQSFSAIGLLLGGVLAAKFKTTENSLLKDIGNLLVANGIIVTLISLVSLIQNSYIVIFLVIVLELGLGIVVSALNIPIVTWLSTTIPEEHQGKIFSIFMSLAQLLISLGTVVSAVIVTKLSYQEILSLAGILELAIAIIYIYAIRKKKAKIELT